MKKRFAITTLGIFCFIIGVLTIINDHSARAATFSKTEAANSYDSNGVGNGACPSSLDSRLTLMIPSLLIGERYFSTKMTSYTYPTDPDTLYWKLEQCQLAEACLKSATLDANMDIKIPELLYENELFEISLSFEPEFTDGLYWKSGKITDHSTANFSVVDTGQTRYYNSLTEIRSPSAGSSFYGQDAQHTGNAPSYTDNGDGTIIDNVTGLMWQQDPGRKMTYDEAVAGASVFDLAGYTDWRLPTIKELYSLIIFSGIDPSGYSGTNISGLTPFIETDYFSFEYGDTYAGERIIDSQFASATKYVSTTMNGADTMFGVNFADGRIKGYGTGVTPGQPQGKTFFVLYVRGNSGYGKNSFINNGDGTITDSATSLMWSKDDSRTGMDWEEALSWVEQKNNEKYLGYDDWRLPNAKELQSIVDYTRSPDSTGSAAIDPLFEVTSITNEAGQIDYPFYWTSTTHANWTINSGRNGVYVAFGRGLGYMNGSWIDVHGAGCQRSDPKSGDPADYPKGHGPQGDAIRIYNYVRCVRNIN